MPKRDLPYERAVILLGTLARTCDELNYAAAQLRVSRRPSEIKRYNDELRVARDILESLRRMYRVLGPGSYAILDEDGWQALRELEAVMFGHFFLFVEGEDLAPGTVYWAPWAARRARVLADRVKRKQKEEED